MVLRPGTLAAQMPFAREERAVARLLQRLGQRGVRRWQVADVFGHQQFDMPLPGEGFPHFRADPIGDAMPAGVSAQQDAGPRRTAHLTSGVAPHESHAAAGQRVNVGRLVERAPLDADVFDAVIINQDEEDVGMLGSSGLCQAGEQTERGDEKRSHSQVSFAGLCPSIASGALRP